MEIRQSFSMLMLDPEQLVILKKDGACTFKIPEWAFDLQYPGHYRRRIVSVQLTMPCIVGPYQNVAATLTFINGKLNKLGKEGGTALFPFGGSKMVATSSAQNDGGQFDLNFRDERYLPFEGAGAVESEWRLELPALRSFDYNAIADVIFHISYRSKYDGVFKLKVEDINNPNGLLSRLNTITDSNPLKKLISMKHDFPNEWHLLNQPSNIADMEIELRKENFPYFANVSSIYGIATNAYSLDSNNNLDVNNSHGISFTASTYKVLIPSTFGDGNFKDLMFIVQYKIG
ncbi:MAG: hypothetical protein IPL25_10220 [Saprospiraceae bacterium]|nr:hypothetical protein [Candidatus Vicinibacter affinis]